MTNRSPERRDRGNATGSFEEWIEQRARERDSSREHVLEQLLDSYWTLEQITQVLGRETNTRYSAEGNQHSDDGQTRTVTEPAHTEVRDSIESLERKLEAASRRRAELRDDVRALADRVDELAQTVDELGSELETEQRRLDDRIDDEFDNLQTILEHLVRATDEHRDQLSDIETQYCAEIRQLRAEREQLRRLREQARSLGTHTADCEQCGASLDFALLTSPDCPNCERPLSGVEAATNWFVFTSYTATTGRRATTTESSDVERSDPNETPTVESSDESPDSERQTTTADAATDRGDESAGTHPDETEFQWLT